MIIILLLIITIILLELKFIKLDRVTNEVMAIFYLICLILLVNKKRLMCNFIIISI